MALIFISHATQNKSKTENILDKFKKEGLESIFLSYHDEHGIEIGERWAKVIYKKLNEAHVVVLLLTPEWTDSFWCRYEYQQARAMGKWVLPLIVEPGDVDVLAEVSDELQHYDMTSDEQTLTKLIRKIKKLIVNIKDTSGWDKSRSPFPGFRAFEYEDRQVFWGKEEDTYAITTQLSEMQHYGRPKLLLLMGASGMGKSSLLKAGVIPALEREEGKAWVILPILRPSKRPLEALAKVLASYLHMEEEEEELLLEALNSSTYHTALDSYMQRIAKETQPILLPLDQAEELYSVADASQKEQFLNILSYLLLEKENFYSIWTLRSDYLSNYQLDAQMKGLHKEANTHPLSPFEISKLSEIIRNPAKLADIEVDEALIEQIKEDMVDTDALPLLALCLRELYTKHVSSGKFTLSDYLALTPDESNPLEALVQQKADEAIARYRDDASVMQALKSAFIPLLIKVDPKDKQVTSQVALWKEMPLEAREPLEALVERRLLIKNTLDGVETLEISHEALFRVWSLLSDWIEEEEEFLIGKAQLEVSLAQWQDDKLSKKEKKKALLSGIQLEKSLGWKDKLVDESEITYIKESKIQKDKNKRIKITLFVLSLVFLIGFSLVSYWQKGVSDKAREIAEYKEKEAKHNLGLALIEKSLFFTTIGELPKAELYATKALTLIDNTLYKNHKKNIAKSILLNLKSSLARLSGYKEFISTIIFSPNGKTLAIGFHNNGIIKLLDLNTQKEIATFKGHVGTIQDIFFALDGKTLISRATNTIKIWDINTQKEITTISQRYYMDNSYIALSSDGKILATCSDNHTIRIRDLNTRKEIAILKNIKSIKKIIFSPNGKILAVSLNNHTIKLWDLNIQKEIAILKGHTSFISNIIFSPNGKILASDSFDKTIKLWDIQSAQELTTFKAPSSYRHNINFSPDSKTLLFAINHDIKFWDIYNKIFTGLYYHSSTIRKVIFSPDGKILISLGFDNIVKLFSLQENKEIMTIGRKKKNIIGVSLSPNGKLLILSLKDKSIEIWDLNSFENKKELRGGRYPNDFTFSPDGRLFASSFNDKIELWDIKTYKKIILFEEDDTLKAENISFSPDGKVLAVNYKDKGIVKLWDLNTYEEITTINNTNRIYDISFSADGKILAVACEKGMIKLWDIVNTYKEIITLNANQTEAIRNINFSPNGNILASTSYHKSNIKLWDLNTYQEIDTPIGHSNTIRNVAFSPNGHILATTSDDHTIKLWDTKTYQEISTLIGHSSTVYNVAFSLDGNTIASVSMHIPLQGDSYNIIRLWDAKTYQEISVLKEKYGDTLIAFSTDSKTLAYRSSNGAIKFWDIKQISLNKKQIKTNISYLEYKLQSHINGLRLLSKKIPYIKSIGLENYALHWLDKAESGDAEAMYQLGIIYDRDGENDKAMSWYKKSLKAGYAPAKERVEFLTKWMKEHPGK